LTAVAAAARESEAAAAAALWQERISDAALRRLLRRLDHAGRDDIALLDHVTGDRDVGATGDADANRDRLELAVDNRPDLARHVPAFAGRGAEPDPALTRITRASCASRGTRTTAAEIAAAKVATTTATGASATAPVAAAVEAATIATTKPTAAATIATSEPTAAAAEPTTPAAARGKERLALFRRHLL